MKIIFNANNVSIRFQIKLKKYFTNNKLIETYSLVFYLNCNRTNGINIHMTQCIWSSKFVMTFNGEWNKYWNISKHKVD